MSCVIYNGCHIIKHFKSERGAKGALTRKYKARYPDAKVCSLKYFNDHIDHEVTTSNIMSGKSCRIMASQVGGCCDPGTETYHCM